LRSAAQAYRGNAAIIFAVMAGFITIIISQFHSVVTAMLPEITATKGSGYR
jgi:hypothetical protein